MGLYLGLSVAPALLSAFLSGTLVGLVILAREGASARKKAVPFGVFLALGGTGRRARRAGAGGPLQGPSAELTCSERD